MVLGMSGPGYRCTGSRIAPRLLGQRCRFAAWSDWGGGPQPPAALRLGARVPEETLAPIDEPGRPLLFPPRGVAAEEAEQCAMMPPRLHVLGHDYGDFPAHDGLWEAPCAAWTQRSPDST